MKRRAAPWALSWYDNVVEYAQLRRRGKRVEVVEGGQWPLDGVTEPLQSSSPETVASHLRSVLGGHHRFPPEVSLVLPDDQCFVLLVRVPDRSTSDFGEAVRWEVGQHLPFELETLSLDWQVVGKESGARLVHVAATPVETAERFARTAELIHCMPTVLAPASQSVAAAFDQALLGNPALLVVLGPASATFAVAHRGAIAFSLVRTVFSEARLLSVIAERFHLTEQEARKALTLFGLSAEHGRADVAEALESELQALLDTCQQLLHATTENGFQHPIERVLLAGAGAMIRGFPALLSERLHLPVVAAPLRSDLLVGHHKPEALAACVATIGAAHASLFP